jgi:putative transposase
MAEQARGNRVHERWGRFRFSVIGQLLAAPPGKGELAGAIAALAECTWHHPISGEPTRFGFSTIERWYYRALKEKRDPVGVLRRKLRADAGLQPAMSGAVRQAIIAQYATHKSWSVRLHHDNLVALAESNPDLLPLPSYATLRRFLKANGFNKRRSLTSLRTEGAERAEARFLDREVRSYEAEHVGGLVHFDAHHGSRTVLTPKGEWVRPILFGVLDDRSRLACHLQRDGRGRRPWPASASSISGYWPMARRCSFVPRGPLRFWASQETAVGDALRPNPVSSVSPR